jgi:aminopeptidase N
MWFGDLTTCRNLNYIWLNESFATYLQVLWDEEFLGRDVFDLDRMIMLDSYLKYVKEEHIIRPLEYNYYDKIDDIYNEEHTYTKGALILHMLRDILGDEDFFSACSYYLQKHAFSNVVSNDFKIAIEEATGRNVDWFFDDWVYGGGHPVLEVSYDYIEKEKVIDLAIQQIQPIIEGQNLFKVPLEISIAISDGIKDKTIWLEKSLEKVVLPCSESPGMVSIDSKGALVAEIHFDKSLEELIYQVRNDQLPGRIRALRQLVKKYPVHTNTIQLIEDIIISSEFWGLKAEATLLLGQIRSIEAQKVINRALQEQDYQIRKAAALALCEFPPEFAQMTLKDIIENDEHHDVVAAAIVALAKVHPDGNSNFIAQQIGRSSWYDEITMACLKAFAEIGDASLVPIITNYITDKYNPFVREAALNAWMSCKPYDDDLVHFIISNYKEVPYYLQVEMITMLESLKEKAAIPLLQEIVDQSGDADFRYSAKRALSEINRVHGK